MRRLFIVVVLATALVSSFAIPARAHEVRGVGELEVVVGWDVEPAVAGFLNAVGIRLTHKEDGDAVTDAKLKVQVTSGDKTSEALTLAPAFGSPGYFKATMVPTRAGEYTFHFTGTAHGAKVDQKFTSGEDTFDSPANPTEVAFPEQDPQPFELEERLVGSETRLTKAAADAKDKASLGTILGIVGVALGLIALLVALFRKPKTTT